MKVTIYTDGASRGNPGPGGYGAVLEYIDTKGNITIPCKWRYIGFYEKGIYEVEDSRGNRLFIDNSGKVVK